MNNDCRVSVKRFSDLSTKEIRRLKKLSFGRNGSRTCGSATYWYLNSLVAGKRYANNIKAIMLINKWGTIVSWASLRKFRKDAGYTTPLTYSDEVELNIFTDTNYRKLGLGTKLVDEVKRYCSKTWKRANILAYAHDDVSRSFYSRNGFTPSNVCGEYITEIQYLEAIENNIHGDII